MRALAGCSVLAGLVVSCVPWTVVPIDEEAGRNAAADPAAYVESIWESRLLPTVRENAVDLSAAVALHREGQGQHFLVKGRGQVLSLDTASRSGKLLLDLEPYDGVADAALLVGPVILGTALRDASGFIEFTDFVNQLEYADVANELNQRVMAEVVGPLDLASLPGKAISFLGAWTASTQTPPEIVPVEVAAE